MIKFSKLIQNPGIRVNPRLSVVLLIFSSFLLLSCGEKKEEFKIITGSSMGTTWTLSWRGNEVSPSKPSVEKVLEKWEQVLSQYRPDSDLSLFNSGQPATPDLQRVIDLALDVQKQSAGAFDPNLLQQTSEAGFGPPGKGKGTDLSGIGKGFSVDRVTDALIKDGLTDFIFELGGEVRATGGEWEVAIENPDPASVTVSRFMKLKNQSLATSGNYRQFKPAPSGLSSHIIDPSTGMPVIRQPSSVTVIAKDCATADAWATALFVLGSEVPAPSGLMVKWNKPKE